MSSYYDSRCSAEATDMWCFGCQGRITRGVQYLRFYKTAWWQPWHIECAKKAGLHVRCLEPTAERCQPSED